MPRRPDFRYFHFDKPAMIVWPNREAVTAKRPKGKAVSAMNRRIAAEKRISNGR